MRIVQRLLLTGLSLFVTSVVIAQQSASKPVAAQPSTPRPATSRPTALRPVATVQDLMLALVDPSSDVIFAAVATTISTRGVETKAPRNDNEWAVVRNNALTLIEAGNLLTMGGRRIASPASAAAAAALSDESASVADKAAQIELTPEQIERRVASDRATWTKRANELIDAGMRALRAADAKDVEALLEAGDGIDAACERCHLVYWYPKEKKPQEKKPQ
jgi:hypothetical protein